MIDVEKIPGAPRASVEYAGVTLVSRYGKRSDLETMMAAIDHVADRAPAVLYVITSVFCDTEMGDCYSIECCRAADAPFVAGIFDRVFRAVAGGHNGIDVESKDGSGRAYADPWWSGDGSDVERMKRRGAP